MKPQTVAEVVARINAVPRNPRLVCIDGPAGAGKTTLAQLLATELGNAQVIHLDEMYEGWQQPLGVKLTERLTHGIVDRLNRHEPLYYHRYDWHLARFTEVVELEVGSVVIVEGVGAGQECMRERADLVVFIDIDPATGRERVHRRDGEEVFRHMDDWQRAEQEHFHANGTRTAADLVLRGDRD